MEKTLHILLLLLMIPQVVLSYCYYDEYGDYYCTYVYSLWYFWFGIVIVVIVIVTIIVCACQRRRRYNSPAQGVIVTTVPQTVQPGQPLPPGTYAYNQTTTVQSGQPMAPGTYVYQTNAVPPNLPPNPNYHQGYPKGTTGTTGYDNQGYNPPPYAPPNAGGV